MITNKIFKLLLTLPILVSLGFSQSVVIGGGVNSGGVNAQSGTSYTVVATDQGKLVTFNNASPVAVTLPNATGQFGAGWYVDICNYGAGLVTITPTTAQINGASTFTEAQNVCDWIYSDGTNYSASVHTAGGSGYATIQNNGTSQTARSILNAQAGLTAFDDGTSKTVLRRPMFGDSGYQQYMREDFLHTTNVSVGGTFVGDVTDYTFVNQVGAGAQARIATAVAGYNGGWTATSGATSGNQSALCSYITGIDTLPGASATSQTIDMPIRLEQIANNAFEVGVYVQQGQGGCSQFLTTRAGMWFSVTNTASAGTWNVNTQLFSGSWQTTTNATSPAKTADTSAHVLRLVITSSTVTFFYDGTQVGSISTNIITSRLSVGWSVKTNTSSATTIDLLGWSWLQ